MSRSCARCRGKMPPRRFARGARPKYCHACRTEAMMENARRYMRERRRAAGAREAGRAEWERITITCMHCGRHERRRRRVGNMAPRVCYECASTRHLDRVVAAYHEKRRRER